MVYALHDDRNMASTPDPTASASPSAPTVFLSYASEDRGAAETLRDALSAHGVDVWLDATGLVGGDAWDQKIRKQIQDCDFFMPLISERTQARHEGYFRREWRLAAERSLSMADDHIFLLPVVIDSTPQSGARVPEKFLTAQWTWVPGGRGNAALQALCQQLLSGKATRPSSSGVPPGTPPPPSDFASALASLMQVKEQVLEQWRRAQEQRQSAELQRQKAELQQLRNAQRQSLREERRARREQRPRRSWIARLITACVSLCLAPGLIFYVSPEHGHKVVTLVQTQGAAGVVELAAQVGQRLEAAASAYQGAPLLAIPFGAPDTNPAGRKVAESAFSQVYGRLALSHHGQTRLLEESFTAVDTEKALSRAREQHARYVLFGAVEAKGTQSQLTVKLLSVEDSALSWTRSYPIAHPNLTSIAEDVDHQVPLPRAVQTP